MCVWFTATNAWANWFRHTEKTNVDFMIKLAWFISHRCYLSKLGTEHICSLSFSLSKLNYLNFNPGNPTTENAVIRA